MNIGAGGRKDIECIRRLKNVDLKGRSNRNRKILVQFVSLDNEPLGIRMCL